MHSFAPPHLSYDSQLLDLTVYQPTDHTYHLEQIFLKKNFNHKFSMKY